MTQKTIMKLESTNVFLDTSTLEENNFLAGYKIKTLLKHAEDETIQVYSSKIAIRELKERIRKRITEAKSAMKKVRKEYGHTFNVLRNTSSYSSVENFWEINFSENMKTIYEELDSVISDTPINCIESNGVNIDEIFDKYFETIAPFKEGKKKSEFPDAFILASIEKWCADNDSKMIIISGDKDWLSYDSKYLIKYREIDLLLSNISEVKKIHLKEKKLEFIDSIFPELEKNLEPSIEEFFADSSDVYEFDVEITSIEVLEFKWESFNITDLDEDHVSLETTLRVNLEVDVLFDVLDNALYDKEDDKWYFVETGSDTFQQLVQIQVDLGVFFDVESEHFEIEYEQINNGKMIFLDYERP